MTLSLNWKCNHFGWSIFGVRKVDFKIFKSLLKLFAAGALPQTSLTEFMLLAALD